MNVKIWAIGIVATSMAGLASADMVFIDFENYPDGKIANGFDGWKITDNKWDQKVVSGGAINGNKSWLVSDKITSGSFSDQPFSPALNDKVGETQAMNYFTASMLFKPMIGGVAGEGSTISIDNGNGQRGNYIRIESTGNDLWKVFVYDFNSAINSFVYTELASGISAGSVHNLSFSMLFNPGANNDVWKVSLDGNPLFTGVGWEDYYRNNAPSFGPSPAVYDRLLFRFGGGPAYPNAAGILFDDIRYSSSALGEVVPGPAAALPFGLGLLAAFRKRSRR